jgi:uncharacterized protein YyaL (SSP411 family)
MLTQRGGGWPLTMFLTHDDQQPFFGGTYFPHEARFGMPAFRDLLVRVAEYYRERVAEVREQNAALMRAFADLSPAPAALDQALHDGPLHAARREIESGFDRTSGGFGAAPKFPHPATIEGLLRRWRATADAAEPDLQALYMATLTLTRMAEGGLYDQLGGGFCRYSVDEYWMIPHFEKMLYDNGALLACYAQAAIATGDDLFAQAAAGTADWLLRDLRAPPGGFWSSLDADSEGHEGRFYVWQAEQVRALLEPAEYAVFAPRFGLDREPNFEAESWHLHSFRPVEDIAASLGIGIEVATARLDSARAKLLEVRRKRIWPGRDEKLLTSWNALTIRGLAMAARALRRADLQRAAGDALDRIRTQLWRDGRLLATCRDDVAQLPAYLDDYVMLADAILELLQVRWRSADLQFARELIEVVLARFEDREAGGFYFTADDHEALIHRSKSFADEATPSGNGVAAYVLQRMGWLLGETRYLAAAARTLRASWRALERYPQGHMTLVTALDEHLQPPQVLVLRGAAESIAHWRGELDRLFDPRRLILAIPADADNLPLSLAAKSVPADGSTVAYLCRGSTCSAPITTLSELARDLRLNLER